MKEEKSSFKPIDIVNCVTCVFVVHFRSPDTFKVCKLTVSIHVSTKTCVTDFDTAESPDPAAPEMTGS